MLGCLGFVFMCVLYVEKCPDLLVAFFNLWCSSTTISKHFYGVCACMIIHTHALCLAPTHTHIHAPLWQPLYHVVLIVSWSLTKMQIFFLLMNTFAGCVHWIAYAMFQGKILRNILHLYSYYVPHTVSLVALNRIGLKALYWSESHTSL